MLRAELAGILIGTKYEKPRRTWSFGVFFEPRHSALWERGSWPTLAEDHAAITG